MKRVPNSNDEAKRTEENKQAAVCHDHPFWNHSCESCLRAKTACQCEEASTDPRCICALRGEYRAIGRQLGTPVGAVLDPFSAASHRLRAGRGAFRGAPQ